MKHLTSDEIRQRFIEYFKALEEGQGHKDILFEDQLLPIIANLSISNNQDIDWVLPFSDIPRVRQEFLPFPPYYNRSSEESFFEKLMSVLKGDDVVRKKQFLDLICKKMQITHSRSLQNNQQLKKELDKLIANKKPISGEFIFKLYQNKYIHLKEPNRSEEINTHLAQTFSDKDERYITHNLQVENNLSVTRLILLRGLADQYIEGIIANTNNNLITNQSYYDYMNNQSEPTKKAFFNKLFNGDQYFIDIITKIISESNWQLSDGDEKYLIYNIQRALLKERKDFIASYIWNNSENTVSFFKECGFISSTDKEFEVPSTDKKPTPDTGKHILKIYEQKFFMDPLRKIAQEKTISFDEKGFYQICRNKEQEAFRSISKLPIYALDIAFLLANKITLSNTQHGHKLRDLILQAKEALSSLIFPLYKLNGFIADILKITKDHYPQFEKRYDYIVKQDMAKLFNEIKAEKAKEQKEEKKKEQQKKEEKIQQQEPKDILIKTIRIRGFRGLENIEIDLEKTTVLTGANNTGKSSILYALQLAFGNHQFISQDDFFIKENSASEEIIIDTLIVPVDDEGNICENFTDDWVSVFQAANIKPDPDDSNRNQFPFRTKIKFDPITNSFKKKQFSINGWPKFKDKNTNWFDKDDGDKIRFYFDEIPFFYIDAQRDILKDIKLKSSYLGKMISKIEYTEKDIKDIEDQIKSLNEKAVDSSAILSHIKIVLGEINSTMGNDKANVEITPFTKKVRDLNKGLSIYYGEQTDSFSMEYHGMGTRSWSSLLTLKAFISSLTKKFQEQDNVFFPILAIEEPEAHLHPNAQKQLYHQINSIEGQKIISTHSPYVAAKAKIRQIRGLYKSNQVTCGKVTGLSSEDESKIEVHVTHTHGEIIFSNFIVFSEGKTESRALPIFAEKFFQKHPSDIGLNFVGVGGKNYAPFIKFAKSLNIPCFIFSDADQNTVGEVETKVLKIKKDPKVFVVFLDDGNDFEKQLISNGFQEQIKKAYLSLHCKNEQHKAAKKEEVESYDDERLLEIMKDDKIRMGEAVAKEIIKGNKLPPKIENLFNKIKDYYNNKDKTNVSKN